MVFSINGVRTNGQSHGKRCNWIPIAPHTHKSISERQNKVLEDNAGKHDLRT